MEKLIHFLCISDHKNGLVCKVQRFSAFYTWVSWRVSWGLPAFVVIGISSPSSPESWREPPTRPQQAFWLNPFLNFSYMREHMKYRISLSIKKNSYTENGVDERIVATIAHGNPVTNEKYHVDIFIAVKGKKWHGVWKSQKKSHSTLRAKRATFTKVHEKMPKWSIWRVFENSVTRHFLSYKKWW